MLITEFGLQIVEVPSGGLGTENVISIHGAAVQARGEFGLDDSEYGIVTLAYLSTPLVGKETQMDPCKPSDVIPALSDHLVWLVTFTTAPIPVIGNVEAGPDTPPPDRPLVVAIDAALGSFL